MRTFLFYLVVLEASFLVQGWLVHFPLIGIRLDCVWLVVVYLGFFVPLFPGGLSVLLIALAEESLGAPCHGIVLLSWLPVYLFLRLTHHHLFFEKGFSQVTWIVLLTLLQKGIEQGLLFWQGYVSSPDLWHLLPSSLLAGLVSLPLFSFLKGGGRIHRYGT